MAYTINSGKDSHGDEQLFMEEFNQNRQAIENYKRMHGGDLEGAFQAVTGKPWPAGRSVKLHDGMPEMTKDRTTKSVLGKYVAPIGAAAAMAFVPGLAPSLLHAFGIGGGSAAPSAAGGAFPGLGAGGGLAGTGGSVAAGSELASTAIPGLTSVGTVPGLTSSLAGTGVQGLAAGGGLASKAGGLIKNLMGKEGIGDKLGDLGKTIGSFGEAEAQNRTQTGEFMQNYDQIKLQEAANRRNDEADAMRKLQQSAYIGGGGTNYKPPTGLQSGTLNPNLSFGFEPRPTTADEQSGANTLKDQMLKRLQPGGSYTATDPTTYTKPGTAENISKWGGLAASGLGMFGNQKPAAGFGIQDLMKLFGK